MVTQPDSVCLSVSLLMAVERGRKQQTEGEVDMTPHCSANPLGLRKRSGFPALGSWSLVAGQMIRNGRALRPGAGGGAVGSPIRKERREVFLPR